MYWCLQKLEGVGFPEAIVIGGFELPSMESQTQILVLWRKSMHSYDLNLQLKSAKSTVNAVSRLS